METRLYKQVAEKIQAMIASEGYLAGDRLPSERELSAKLAVSRASLREGLIALELTGVVEVRSNSGVYLSERPGTAPALPETGPGPFEVLSARRVIESEIAAIAAQVATDRAIDAILVAVEAMERHHDDVATNELADRNFHMAIANATGNSALVGVMNHLWDQRGHLWQRLKEHFQTEELRKETLGDHRAILQAIASHDPAAARKAMRVHLGRVTRTFSA
jgi:GntR family transcriptional regulator, uxu operon transcriptional repressor